MKFPVKNSKSQNNHHIGKKPLNNKAGLNKGVKNQRNPIQQQRVNTLHSAGKSMSKKRVHNEEDIHNKYADNNVNNFDDEVQGMDANLHISHRNDFKGGKRENKQYNDLMQESGKGFRREKNKYFLQNEKYQGRKSNEDEDDQVEERNIEEEDNEDNLDENNAMIDQYDEEQVLDQDEDQQQQDEQEYDQQSQQADNNSQQANNQIQQALSQLQKKRQSTSKLIQSQLESINLEDKKDINQVIKAKSKSTQQEYQQALGLKKLLQIYDKLVEARYGQQRQLQQIKKYPKINQQDDTPTYPPMSHQLFTLSRELEDEVLTNISHSLKLYKTLANNTLAHQKQSHNDEQIDEQTAVDLEQMLNSERENVNSCQDDVLVSGRLNVDKIYNLVKSTITKETALVEKELIKWSQKTSFLSSSSSTHLNSLLMQTPVGQAKKVLSNWERMVNKCQQKRGQQLFKILFQAEDNIHTMTDAQIYDDYDLFIELEKYYLEKVNDQNQDNEFLSSATLKYLKNKQANQLNHERKQKDVDRKASKNRKIRYGVHTKLLNFMPAVQENVIETRDEIVKNMFNCNARVNEQAGEGNTYRVRGQLLEEELIDVE